MTIERLQQIGLTKYEAEAYLALLQYGALTGYELGKRSAVPLSRSYETLERLAQKGFALIQPGDPPRYSAATPEAIIARARAAQALTLDTLATELATIAQRLPQAGYWVARGATAVVTEAESLISAATATVGVIGSVESFDGPLAAAQSRRCRVARHAGRAPAGVFALLIDNQRALLGRLTPAHDCQAIVGSDPALLAAVQALIDAPQARPERSPAPTVPPQRSAPLDWLDWETRKQRRLLGLGDTEAA